MNKLLVICGPTAIGKTSLAIKLAKSALGGKGEIVSADSRQVYKGMDIGTGKDINNSKFKMQNSKLQCKIQNYQIGFYEINGVKVWLYDVVKPDYQFNIADYVECANLVIKNIWERGKLPILAGGTGFYIKGVVDGIETLGVEPDWELRKKLSNLEIEKLREELERTCPERLRGMNESDRNNPRRLIRAIEITTRSQSAKCKVQSAKLRIGDLLTIGLKAPYKELYERIDKRVKERVAQGVEKEIKQLLKKDYTFENSVLGTTLGYREWQPRFSNIQYPISDIVQRWQFDEHNYARRQMTWFRSNKRINWFDLGEKDYQEKVARFVKEWYDK